MKDAVHRSTPVSIMRTSPYGNTSLARIRTRQGVFSCIHGDVLVTSAVPHANASRQPADTPLRKMRCGAMLALLWPMRPMARTPCTGESLASDISNSYVVFFNGRLQPGSQSRSNSNGTSH